MRRWRTVGTVAVTLLATAGFIGLVVAAVGAARDGGILSPTGPVARQERDLLGTAALLSLVVLAPVFAATLVIAVRYRAGAPRNRSYEPNQARQPVLEIVWWAVPALLIAVLSVITWTSSHELDPYAPLTSTRPTVEVDVVALDWKWLFIYPQSGVASVNELEIPEGTPVHLTLTSDAPMNSFWIPQLSGQIYAMPGMQTQLNLEASSEGEYRGASANLSGAGFSGMRFTATVVSPAAFAAWQSHIAATAPALTASVYDTLRMPSSNVAPEFFTCSATSLVDSILARYQGSPMPMPSAAP